MTSRKLRFDAALGNDDANDHTLIPFEGGNG
jgi:hypothetical protein